MKAFPYIYGRIQSKDNLKGENILFYVSDIFKEENESKQMKNNKYITGDLPLFDPRIMLLILKIGGVLGAMIIVVKNVLRDPSSNSGQDYVSVSFSVHVFGKCTNNSLLSPFSSNR